jgi:hypothetical protein
MGKELRNTEYLTAYRSGGEKKLPFRPFDKANFKFA